MKRSLLILTVAALVTLAGCTATTGNTSDSDQPGGFEATVTPNDGLSIDLTSDSTSYRTGERARIRVQARNTGEGDAVVHEILLTKANWIDPMEARVLWDLWTEGALEFIQDAVQAEGGGIGFGVLENVRPQIQDWVDGSLEEAASRLDNQLGDDVSITADDISWTMLDPVMLDRVDKANNLNGGRNTWTASPLVNPPLPSGSEESYNIGAKVVYNYDTRSRTTTTVKPVDQYTRENTQPPQASTDTSAGPIDVNAELPEELPAQEDTVQVPIVIRNVGEGRLEDDEIDRITVQAESQYATVERCTPGFDGYEIQFGDLINWYQLIAKDDAYVEAPDPQITAARVISKLTPGMDPKDDMSEVVGDLFLSIGFAATGRDVTVFGDEHTFSCDLDIDAGTVTAGERDISLKTFLNYDYVERKEISVTVQGQ